MQQVYGRLGSILRWEGAYHINSVEFYIAVVKTVLLFRQETWVLLTTIDKRLAGVHTDF